ncbi:MAG: SUMF1/EgtB/PvdO family nonheme iron enzyme, partial [Deltaproteobacteria bacterium]|nr:SUMF1/EgtB/PvdO family nonheme iron enzyme [Deltaproteobacteria bacterium]
MTRIMGAGLLLGLLAGALALPGGVRAEDDTEVLAEAIAASLKDNLKDPRYRTVAVSRIRPAGTKANINDLIDLINVKIVRSRHLKVIDRSRLQLILKEQKVQLSDVVSTKKYQELGKLMGVDLFIYGTFYKDTLILKGIDVQNSSLAWGEVFVITPSLQNEYLSSLAKKVVTSLGSDQERLNKSRIRLVSFWDVYAGPFTAFAVMDYIAVALTRDARFRVVDRENMQLVTKEQQLNQEVYIDESTAKKLGELYGVDGFIYGNISSRGNGSYRASLKLLSIYSGVIEWADLITLKAVQQAEPAPVRKSPPTPAGMVYVFPGGFTMGRSNDEIINGPEHKLSLPGFFIDEYEISNQDYARFIKST